MSNAVKYITSFMILVTNIASLIANFIYVGAAFGLFLLLVYLIIVFIVYAFEE